MRNAHWSWQRRGRQRRRFHSDILVPAAPARRGGGGGGGGGGGFAPSGGGVAFVFVIIAVWATVLSSLPTTSHGFVLLRPSPFRRSRCRPPRTNSSASTISMMSRLVLGASKNEDSARAPAAVVSNDGNGSFRGPTSASASASATSAKTKTKKKVVVIGAGWGGLSAAYALSKMAEEEGGDDYDVDVTVVEASSSVGGLVRDGFTTMSGLRPAEAGQHGFWNNYHNILRLLREILGPSEVDGALTSWAEQGQYSPNGLEAVWPVYRDQPLVLPTGLAQAVYTRFENLSVFDRLTALPLVLAFSELFSRSGGTGGGGTGGEDEHDDDDDDHLWRRYDSVSFRDLCIRLGVSRRCYDEAFEPMILTGLFAPGAECSAAAALGMAYFFVLQSQTAFDVRWCRGNVGDVIFAPWVRAMTRSTLRTPVRFLTSTRVVGFVLDEDEVEREHAEASSSSSSGRRKGRIKAVKCRTEKGKKEGNGGGGGGDDDDDDERVFELEATDVIFAVGAEALNRIATSSSEVLGRYEEFRRFANLRGTSVLATRIFLDRVVNVPYTANACWGFDDGIGMTVFDVRTIHGDDAPTMIDVIGSVLEVDYYHAAPLLAWSDEDVVSKVKRDLDAIFGTTCRDANVVDAAVVRLSRAVNWYYPGSYRDMPGSRSDGLANVYFAGDIVRTKHGSWSQEKAFVTGVEAANHVMGYPIDRDVLPVGNDEWHVQLGRTLVEAMKKFMGLERTALVDFLW